MRKEYSSAFWTGFMMLVPSDRSLDKFMDKSLTNDEMEVMIKEMDYRKLGMTLGLSVFASSIVFFILGIVIILLGHTTMGSAIMLIGAFLHPICLFGHIFACHKKRDTHVSLMSPRRAPRF